MAMENDGIPEHLMSKLAKCGMPDDGDHDQMMAAYMTYMSTTDDGPSERQEMRKAMEAMERREADMDEPEAKMDMDDSDETSEDKSKKMSAKLRRDASLDPAVAKLVEWRSYFIVAAFIVAAVVTPPDVVSQLSLAIPMCLLYELGILAARLVVRSTPPAEPAGEEEA